MCLDSVMGRWKQQQQQQLGVLLGTAGPALNHTCPYTAGGAASSPC
jgi:hypothetical protein